MYSLMSFDRCGRLGNHDHRVQIRYRTLSSLWRVPSRPFAVNALFPFPASGNHCSNFYPCSFVFSGSSYEWHYTACSQGSLTSYDYPCCCVYSLHFFLLLSTLPLYGYTTTCLSIPEWWILWLMWIKLLQMFQTRLC